MIESVNMQPTTKLSQRQWLTFFLLGLLLIALLLIGQWLWLTRTLSASEPQIVLPSERMPLLTSLLRQKAVVWSLLTSAVTLMLALLVAVSPLAWWAQLSDRFRKASSGQPVRIIRWGQEPQTAEEWVAAQAAFLGMPPTAPATDSMGTVQPDQTPGAPPLTQGQPQPGAPGAPGQPPLGQQPGVSPAPGQPPPAQQSGVPGQTPPAGAPPAPGQQSPAQQPGAPQAQPPGQAAQPGVPPAAGQQLPAQPGAPQPPGQPAPTAQPPQPGLQQLLAPEEKMDLKELADIGDILSSFKENDDIPAQLLALSQSLDEVAVEALVEHSRRVAGRLAAVNSAARRQLKQKNTAKAIPAK